MLDYKSICLSIGLLLVVSIQLSASESGASASKADGDFVQYRSSYITQGSWRIQREGTFRHNAKPYFYGPYTKIDNSASLSSNSSLFKNSKTGELKMKLVRRSKLDVDRRMLVNQENNSCRLIDTLSISDSSKEDRIKFKLTYQFTFSNGVSSVSEIGGDKNWIKGNSMPLSDAAIGVSVQGRRSGSGGFCVAGSGADVRPTIYFENSSSISVGFDIELTKNQKLAIMLVCYAEGSDVKERMQRDAAIRLPKELRISDEERQYLLNFPFALPPIKESSFNAPAQKVLLEQMEISRDQDEFDYFDLGDDGYSEVHLIDDQSITLDSHGKTIELPISELTALKHLGNGHYQCLLRSNELIIGKVSDETVLKARLNEDDELQTYQLVQMPIQAKVLRRHAEPSALDGVKGFMRLNKGECLHLNEFISGECSAPTAWGMFNVPMKQVRKVTKILSPYPHFILTLANGSEFPVFKPNEKMKIQLKQIEEQTIGWEDILDVVQFNDLKQWEESEPAGKALSSALAKEHQEMSLSGPLAEVLSKLSSNLAISVKLSEQAKIYGKVHVSIALSADNASNQLINFAKSTHLMLEQKSNEFVLHDPHTYSRQPLSIGDTIIFTNGWNLVGDVSSTLRVSGVDALTLDKKQLTQIVREDDGLFARDSGNRKYFINTRESKVVLTVFGKERIIPLDTIDKILFAKGDDKKEGE